MTFNQARQRVLSAASFDPDTYDDLRDDPTATAYAVAVVVGSTLLAARGWWSVAEVSAVSHVRCRPRGIRCQRRSNKLLNAPNIYQWRQARSITRVSPCLESS
jgi:hypothetical protein